MVHRELWIGHNFVTRMSLSSAPRLSGWSFQQHIYGAVLPPPHSPRQALGCGFPHRYVTKRQRPSTRPSLSTSSLSRASRSNDSRPRGSSRATSRVRKPPPLLWGEKNCQVLRRYRIMSAMLDEIYTKKSSSTQLFSFIMLFLWGVSISMVCYLSLAPRVEFPIGFRWADVVYHFCAYLWLSFLPFIGFRSARGVWISALLMIPLGIGLEFGQHFVPARVFSIMDMVANYCGVMVGIVCGLYLRSTFMRTRYL
jgi:hypothetical protein